MRISEEIQQKLINNWGDHALCLNCYVEIAYHDPLSKWVCYIFAMNPDNLDEISCIIDHFDTIVRNWSLQDLYEQFNTDGEPMEIDHEFRRIHAATLFKRLSETK